MALAVLHDTSMDVVSTGDNLAAEDVTLTDAYAEDATPPTPPSPPVPPPSTQRSMRSQSAASLTAATTPASTSPAKRKAKGKAVAVTVTPSAIGAAMEDLGMARPASDSAKDSIPAFRKNFEVVAQGLLETRGSMDSLQEKVQRLTSTLQNTQSNIAELTSAARATAADVHGLQAAHNALIPLLDNRHKTSTGRLDSLAARVSSVAGHVGTVAGTVTDMEQTLADVQRTVTATQALLAAREAAPVSHAQMLPGPANTHTYITSATTSKYASLPVDSTPANKRMRLDDSATSRGRGWGSRGRGRGHGRGGSGPSFMPMAAHNASAGPSTIPGGYQGGGDHADVLVGRCAWTAGNVRDQFLNMTREIRRDNAALMSNAIVNVSLDDDTAFVRVTFRTYELATLFVQAFNLREATDYPGSFARIVSM